MKRFALKRITALVLALVMTLSLLPMNVWATEGESEQATEANPLYWMRYDWTSDEFAINKGVTDRIRVSIDGNHFLEYDAEKQSVSVTQGLGEVTLISMFENGKEITLIEWNTANASVGEGSISLTVDGTVYSLPVSVNLAWLWMGDKSDGGVRYNETTVVGGKSHSWELWIEKWDQNGKSTPTITEETFTVSTDNQTYADMLSINGNTVTFNAASLTSGDHNFTLIATDKTTNIPYHFRVNVSDPSNFSDIFYREGWDSFGNWRNDRFYMSAGERWNLQFATSGEAISAMSLSDWTVGVDNANIGAVTKDGDTVSWNLSGAIPGASGNITLTKGGVTHTVPVRVTQAVVGVYSNTPSNENLGANYIPHDGYGGYSYTPGAQADQDFYILLNDWMTFAEEQTDISFESGWNNKLAKYTIPADTYGNQRITIQLNEDPYSWEINFKEAERHNTVVGSDGLTSNKEYYPVPIGNTGYYIGPGFSLYDVLKPMNGGYQLLTEGGQINSGIAVGIWKMAPDGVTLELLEGAELAAVTERLKNLNMDIKLVAENNNDNKEYPFIREISETGDPEYYKLLKGENKYPLAKIYTYTQYSVGVWCFTLTGTYTDVDGTEIPFTAYGRDEKRITKMENVSIPAQGTAEATVEYINNLLQGYANKKDTEFILELNLPAGELRGYINVPENIHGLHLWGQTDANRNISTTLVGGIVANNFDVRVANIRFVGAGRDADTWEGTRLPNKAIYGMAGGGVSHCSFTGYDCAIEMYGGVIGAGGLTDGEGHPLADTGAFFYDNNVAIKQVVEGDFFSGDTQYWKMVMVNNGTDIDFEKTDGVSGYEMAILSAIFVRNDNKNSIHNTGGRTFFMPMTAFYNTKNETNNGNNDPKVDGNVSIAPYYTLTEAGKTALVTDLKIDANVKAMLANPTYKEEWISTERLFPRSWICPANPDKELYSVPADNITEEEMTIDIIDNYNDDAYVGTIKLKKNK